MSTKKSARKRRFIDSVFKLEAVRIVHTSGRPQQKIATDIGVSVSALGRWVRDDREADVLSCPHDDLGREIIPGEIDIGPYDRSFHGIRRGAIGDLVLRE